MYLCECDNFFPLHQVFQRGRKYNLHTIQMFALKLFVIIEYVFTTGRTSVR